MLTFWMATLYIVHEFIGIFLFYLDEVILKVVHQEQMLHIVINKVKLVKLVLFSFLSAYKYNTLCQSHFFVIEQYNIIVYHFYKTKHLVYFMNECTGNFIMCFLWWNNNLFIQY